MSILIDPPRAVDGSLLLGDLPAAELAASYETPLFVLETPVFDRAVAHFCGLGEQLGIDVAYAAKALLFVALARRIRASSLLLDCCSLGEIATAEAAGFPPERIYLHGCGKSTEELQAAVEGRVGRIVVDGFDELARLAALSRAERPVKVLLRVNSGIEAHTHEFVRTGGENTKFGFALDEIESAFAAVAREPGLQLVGVHAHVGSQIMDAAPFLANLEILAALYIRAHRSGYTTMHDLFVGGGFGVAMHPSEVGTSVDIEAILIALSRRVKELCAEAGVAPPRLSIEPGRALIAEAGTTLYRIVAIKQHGNRRFAILDGGMTDNPRPALYDSYHHPELASRRSTAVPAMITLCGRACENDQLVEASLPGDIRAGDLVALRVTGAYTFSMASNYNRFTRPAVICVGVGEHQLAVRRESIADLLRNDLDVDA